jgi:hypothetical protein
MKKQQLNYDKTKFKNDAEYTKFLDDKMKSLFVKIEKQVDVFKRLADR